MRLNRKGITRIVLEFRGFVIKFPNPTYSWHHFLKGLLANLQEVHTWRYTHNPLLCPVLWASWGGWFVVMKKADMGRWEDEVYNAPHKNKLIFSEEEIEEETKRLYRPWIEVGLGGDDKADNYGYLDGRLVKVDYG